MIGVAKGALQVRLVEELTPAETIAFDRFVCACPMSSHWQRAGWARITPRTKRQHFRYLIAEAGGEIVLTGVCRMTELFPHRFLAALRRGPVFRDLQVLRQAWSQIRQALERAGACTVLVNPAWQDDAADQVGEVLSLAGFRPLPAAQQPMHSATGLVDLTGTESEILARFKTRCRRHLRAATRRGLIVRRAESDADAARLQGLYTRFAARKGLETRGIPDLLAQWQLARDGGAVFLLAELEGELIGGHVALRHGARGVWLTLASSDAHPSLPRGYNLLWEAMRWLKQAGCTSYDVAGLPQGAARDEGERGRVQFKSAFAPRLVRLVPVHGLPLRPLSHAVLFRARQLCRAARAHRGLPQRAASGGRAETA